MLTLLLYVNCFFSLAYVFWAIGRASKQPAYLTVFLSSVYVLTNGAFLWANAASAANFGYLITEVGLSSAVQANIVFLTACILFLASPSVYEGLGQRGASVSSATTESRIQINSKFLLALALICVLVELRYLLLGGGMARVGGLAMVEGRDSLYTLRYDESLAISEGSGLFSSLLSMRILYPVVALGCCYQILVNRRFSFLLVLASAASVNVVMAMSTLQRSPLFNIVLVTVLSMLVAYLERSRTASGKSIAFRPKHLVAAIPIILVGSGIYAFTEQVGLAEGLYHIVERIFLISSFSSTSYFELFGSGNSLPFAGWAQIMGFPVESNGTEITYRDVGLAANGWPHNLNASFVATAYGAAGWPGIIIVVFALLTITRCTDFAVRRLGIFGSLSIIVLNIFVAFEISNGPMMNGIFAGLGSNIILFVLLFREQSLARKFKGAIY